ncbi:LL-diaminopimelate aminotransferase [Dictyobacter aurantiacus]|uniref:Aminotransferase n=1 Tax=Dictyobacter aurantiacus TaxID=1936993 RepID=A0A401ZHP2_9CHLR|nr:LL-diaminopimelate aminotransferase [Dictyobacter aurantiacus]GCE06401.1 LL-diaminopimelate aminotransferase [Dictyobacter aurantiacus]
MRLSNLINSLPPYHFANAKQKIADRKAAGVDVISLSMGDPDLPAPPAVVERLCAAMQDGENHRYPEYRGMRALHEAIAEWFENRFGVQLTPEQDILPLLGSKEGLAYAATAVLNAGDIALTPNPYYPVYISGATTLGAEPYLLPLREEQNFLPDLDSIPESVLARARVLWLNYPNNPTAACADRAFFEHVVEFARRHDIVIIHDMAYAEVYFDDFRPMSILQVPGARDVAVELHSLSKTYNMAGFRIGMLVGNPELVDAVGRLKSNIDSGIFRPVQYAAIEALRLPSSWLAERNVIYQRRRDLLVEGCNALGMRAEKTRAGLYVWAHVPQGYTSRDFTSWLFDQTGVFITPGTNFGSAGEGYVRISMTEREERIQEALRRMQEVLRKA